MTRCYITVAIPYVNARPHVGYALELVQADVLARHHRARGDDVRFLGGTDDHALKNVLAASATGLGTQAFVDRNAAAFESLRVPLRISFDDFIRTSRDPRHAPGVERLWRACAATPTCRWWWASGSAGPSTCARSAPTPTARSSAARWLARSSRSRPRNAPAAQRHFCTSSRCRVARWFSVVGA